MSFRFKLPPLLQFEVMFLIAIDFSVCGWKQHWDQPLPEGVDYSLDRPLAKRLTEAVVQRQAFVAESRTHAVFLRGGVLVGEHLLPEDDIRQDFVLKSRKVKDASIGVELDGLFEKCL